MQLQFLEAYDRQLRTHPEIAGASNAVAHGPLLMATFPGGRGFVTYAELGDVDADDVALLVDAAADHFAGRPEVRSVEWKTRGHDRAPGLHDALVARDFVPEEPESIMIGEARPLARHVDVPEHVTIRRSRSDADVFAAGEMQGRVFDDPDWRSRSEELVVHLREDPSAELWIAVADDEVISAGRLEPGGRHRVRRSLGRCDAPGVARPRHLPRSHGEAGALGSRAWGPLPPLRFH